MDVKYNGIPWLKPRWYALGNVTTKSPAFCTSLFSQKDNRQQKRNHIQFKGNSYLTPTNKLIPTAVTCIYLQQGTPAETNTSGDIVVVFSPNKANATAFQETKNQTKNSKIAWPWSIWK